jgi:hypothetical protein
METSGIKINNKNFVTIFADELNPKVNGQYAITIKIITKDIIDISSNDSRLYFIEYATGIIIGINIGQSKKSKLTILNHLSHIIRILFLISLNFL